MATKPALISPTSAAFEMPNLASGSVRGTIAVLLLTDAITLSLVFGLNFLVRWAANPSHYQMNATAEVYPCLALMLGAFWVQGLYPGAVLHPAEEMRRITFSVTAVFLLIAAGTFIWRNGESYSRGDLLIACALGSPAVLLGRYLTRRSLSTQPWWGISAIVLGSGPAAQRIARSFRDGMLGVKVRGFLSNEDTTSWPPDQPPVLGDLTSAPRLASTRVAQYVIVAMPDKSHPELCRIIQDYCQGFSHILLIPDMAGLCSLGTSVHGIGGELAFEMPQRLFHRGAAILKRALDLVLASITLLATSPLFLLIALAIRLSSSGPIFYGQSRHGFRGKTFKALKFRTMVPDAEKILGEYLQNNPESLFEWQRDQKLKNDPRVTKIGSWLRRLSLDELPQLINVIAGQMSLVGPRPIVSSEIIKYGRGYELYTRVRPGISGLWQVSGRNNTTYDERIAFDEYYVRNWSIWLDIYLLIRTITVVLKADGAY